MIKENAYRYKEVVMHSHTYMKVYSTLSQHLKFY